MSAAAPIIPAQTPPSAPVAVAPSRQVHSQQAILAGLLLVEIAIFSFFGTHFFTPRNFFEVCRLSVELGLLALAQTPVILTGGIDLSVGSLLGLCAVVFGKLWRDGHCSPEEAAALTLIIAIFAGGMNALFITRLRIPPLIVTLGSYSLFRGLAEGITKGADNFTDFPSHFLFLGQGYISGIPAQLPLFILAAIFFWLLVHRSAVGRALSAIGYSPQGALHAGIPVDARIALTYILSGLASGVAAVIYVAHFGQAKADAGSGYELQAITAVVLGGTSIFGGRASIGGTLLGLFSIAVLTNGLRLSDQTPELAGILTGFLLLAAIGLDWPRTQRPSTTRSEDLDMRNSQLVALCAVILIAALIVTGGNYMLVKNLPAAQPGQAVLSAPGNTTASSAAPGGQPQQPPAAHGFTIAMMPKSKGNPYFIACRQGAEEAAKQLGDTLLWDGPTDTDPAKQNEIVDTWITRGVDVIAVSVDNRPGLSGELRKARAAGIKVVTFDADADPDARDWLVNQATPEGIGNVLMDDTAAAMGGKGEFAIITATLTAANQNEWMKYIEARRAAKYPDIKMDTVVPCDDLQNKAFEQANVILNAYPNVKVIMAISSQAVPAAGEAVKQKGRNDVKVVGLGLPNDNKPYVHAGITPSVVLWNTMDLGYLTVYVADATKSGSLKPGDTSFTAGRLGSLEIKGDNVLLGTPFTFTADNIDKFNF
ncbi:MAG: substrate-binding domain-containing protein [Tepidisphaeraceae bacterium]|jgi:rhamnose transport system permease protein